LITKRIQPAGRRGLFRLPETARGPALQPDITFMMLLARREPP